MKPKISVVMSVFNENFYELRSSINSIMNQTYPNFELIIVDDNPSSLQIKKDLFRLTKYNNNVNVKILFNKVNMGAALSRNKGERRATGTFLAIMDADDIANKNRLLDQFLFLRNNKLDFVFPNYSLISTNNNVLKSKVYHVRSIIDQSKIYYIFSNIRDIAINSGWFLYKYVFDALNGYNNILVEDYDLISRAIVSGYKLGFQSDVLMYVRFRQDSIMRKNALGIFLGTRYIRHLLVCNNVYRNMPSTYKYSKKMKLKFNKFIIISHNLRYNTNVFNIARFLYFLFSTKFALTYTISKLIVKIKTCIYL